MADTTVIGRDAFVRGRISGSGDIEILGRVEGDVACSGDVTVDQGGLVAASISARTIVVRGAVKGDLVAEDSLVIEATARVVGDLRAPRIRIAQGGLVRGHVQTGAAGPAKSAAKVAHRAVPAPVARPAPPVQASAPKPVAAHAPAPRTSAAATVAAKPAPAPPAKSAGRPGPPPPVVPALKKGTKAVHKKR